MDKYSEEDYMNEDWFFGDEAEISCRTRKMVTVRKEHDCYLSQCHGRTPHKIIKGQRAYFEKALIDRDFWGKFYMCTKCMDEALAEYYGNGEL
jgi:hypothetical protein